MMTDYFETMQH